MKRVMIVASGVANADKLIELDQQSTFRKATVNMKLAHLAVAEALGSLDSYKSLFAKDMSLFLGTSHGEFNSTLDFLKSWAEIKLARPFVFQNSLHNSTTGFIGLAQGYKAPACTISHHNFSGEDALDTACQFLKTDMAKIALVVGVDARSGEYLPIMDGAGFPHSGWGQGSGAVILAQEEYCNQNNLPILGEFKSIQMNYQFDHPVHFVAENFDLKNFYDSQAVEVLARAIKDQSLSKAEILKPNGSSSVLSWTPSLGL